VDDSDKYNPRHLYPQPGTFVPSDPSPVSSTGRPIPINVYLNQYAPIKHPQTHGHNVCDLQLRSFYTKHLDFFCNFVLRVAFYLKIPVTGATPLPRRIQRWTVIKSPFVHAKVKENFERRTHKRLIKLYDANPDVVQVFLATVRKHCIGGVGMKATIYSQEDLNFVDEMDNLQQVVPSDSEPLQIENLNLAGVDEKVAEAIKSILNDPTFKPLMESNQNKTIKLLKAEANAETEVKKVKAAETKKRAKTTETKSNDKKSEAKAEKKAEFKSEKKSRSKKQ
jgi:small subunit ribosomal protein S10